MACVFIIFTPQKGVTSFDRKPVPAIRMEDAEDFSQIKQPKHPLSSSPSVVGLLGFAQAVSPTPTSGVAKSPESCTVSLPAPAEYP